ncbi:MAG: hypothetical protein ACW967_07660 [Candidatus Hodarchaeales archaeon]|jgi:hypothetical protein
MSGTGNVKLLNKLVLGVIAGVMGGVVLYFYSLAIHVFDLGRHDLVNAISMAWFGTPDGSPNLFLVLVFIEIAGNPGIIVGIIFGIVIYLLLTRAGWTRNLTRYILIALLINFSGRILEVFLFGTFHLNLPDPNFLVDYLLIDGPWQFGSFVISGLFGWIYYTLEGKYDSSGT